jgi:hypothetical protein
MAQASRLVAEPAEAQGEEIGMIRIERVIQRVAELPDRTSPDDWPDAMLVTAEELRDILESELAAPADRTVAKFKHWIDSTPSDSLTGDSRVAMQAQKRVLRQLVEYLGGDEELVAYIELAAAPVPCAASPADEGRLEFIRGVIEDTLADGPRPSTKHQLERALRAVRIELTRLRNGVRDDHADVQSPVDRPGGAADSTRPVVAGHRPASARDETGQALPLQQLRGGPENATNVPSVGATLRATGEGARDEQCESRSPDGDGQQGQQVHAKDSAPVADAVAATALSRQREAGSEPADSHQPEGAPVAVSLDPHRLPTNDDMPPGNWHAIEGPNGICACGPVEGCPERLQRFIRTAVDFWHAKANFLERERERAVEELPDAFARAPGSLALKIQRYREFVTPYVDLARLRGEATVRQEK